MRHLKEKKNKKWISNARTEISMIPAEKETPVKEEQLWWLSCFLINTKLMS